MKVELITKDDLESFKKELFEKSEEKGSIPNYIIIGYSNVKFLVIKTEIY